jgi:sugar phosphate isomerase/epimerase
MNWPCGLSTGIAYRHPIEDVLPVLADAGFRVIEVSTSPSHLSLDDAERLRRLKDRVGDLGLRVHSLHAPFGHDVNITSPERHQRAHALDRLRRAADLLCLLNPAGLYVLHPGGEDQRWVWERELRLRWSVESLTHVWRACQERGLTLVLETPLPHLLGGQPADFAWILERLPAEGLGVCVDTSHCALGGFLFEALEAHRSRLVHLQASDNRGHTDDHLPPGDGVIDWPHVRAVLERIGYQGVFMLEVTGNGDVAGHVGRLAAAHLTGSAVPAGRRS